MINYIYCYTNLINQKTYIGQTNNLNRRINEHKSNAFNPKSVNYNNIIHKAFRKYGYENFQLDVLEILENASNDQVNEREIFWIKEKHSLISENGYNVLEGGNSNYWKSFLSREQVADIKNMIINKTPYNDIVDKYGISKTFISNINNGKYFFDEKAEYPLCPYRIDTDTYDLLIEDLENTDLSFNELANKYGLCQSTVKKFNYGKLRHGYYKGEYPIRKTNATEKRAELIIDYLLNTDLSEVKIAVAVGSTENTVHRINIGETHRKDYLSYPLR